VEDKYQPCKSEYEAHHRSKVQDTVVVGSMMPYQVSVKHDKLPLLDSMLEKVEKNYCVKIRKDTCSARSNGTSAPDMQKINISGSSGDCKNAGVRKFSFLPCDAAMLARSSES